MMDNPCASCRRQGECDHFYRCRRWRDWFAGTWQEMRKLFSKEV